MLPYNLSYPIVISILAIAFAIFVVYRIWTLPSVYELHRILRDTVRKEGSHWTIEVSLPFGLFKRSIEWTSKAPENDTTEMLTIRIPPKVHGSIRSMTIPSHVDIATESKVRRYRVVQLIAPIDGIFSHDYKMLPFTKEGHASTFLFSVLSLTQTADHFIRGGKIVATVLGAEGASRKIIAPDTGDIFYCLPSGISVREGDTLMLMAIQE